MFVSVFLVVPYLLLPKSNLSVHCAYACHYTDISLFDELDNLGDADELLDALENAGYVSNSTCQYANV